ncbi:MAG: CaiB/BaiF CoA transferase family protein, partial [Gemmataceae bacterium]
LAAAREAAYRGENNVEVMKEYGYSDQEIAALISSGVLLTNVPPRPSPPMETPALPDGGDVLKQAS